MHSLSPGNASLEPKRSCIIELELRGMSQLFNSMDPSPVENKDLNDAVEEFIVSSSEEYHPDQALTLRIYLEDWPTEDLVDLVRNSIHNYFAYRASLNRLAFRRLMRRGRSKPAYRIVVPRRLPRYNQALAGRSSRDVGRYSPRESDDRRLGRDVAADGDISL